MKRGFIRQLILTFSFLFFVSYALGQCPYDNHQKAIVDAPFALNETIHIDSVRPGEFIRIRRFVKDNLYSISTCSNLNYDSYITIYPSGGGTPLQWASEGCISGSGAASVTVSFNSTGEYDIIVDGSNNVDPCISDTVFLSLDISLLQMSQYNQEPPLIIIPVAVHVVYSHVSQNISDQLILAQIEELNQDFRKNNFDTIYIPGTFLRRSADMKIEFCLAVRTSSGLATNGITRTQTIIPEFSNNDGVKFSSRGGKDPWDTQHYLNVWVCNLGSGGLMGYAQFPEDFASSPQTDGVVIDYRAFGYQRTLVHEVGHWLSLRHIWGDAVCGDDFVSDTPTQQDHNYQCPSFPHFTCNNYPNGDMFMNFMDYVDDNCMLMFSEGQRQRAESALYTYRNSLFQSNGCQVVGVDEIGWLSGLMVSPNPGSGKFIISGSIPENEKINVTVFNMLGQIIYPLTDLETLGKKIDLSLYKPGIYLFKFNCGAGNNYCLRVVKE